jgi:hypothetical protein
MRLRLAVLVFCPLAVLASHVVQGSGASAGSNAGRQADLAGIEKFHQRDTAATPCFVCNAEGWRSKSILELDRSGMSLNGFRRIAVLAVGHVWANYA